MKKVLTIPPVFGWSDDTLNHLTDEIVASDEGQEMISTRTGTLSGEPVNFRKMVKHQITNSLNYLRKPKSSWDWYTNDNPWQTLVRNHIEANYELVFL